MKKRDLLFALSATLLLLGSCASETDSTSSGGEPSSTGSSSTTETSDTSSSSSSSSSVVQDDNYYGVTILTSRYGNASCDTQYARVGETINISVTCTAEGDIVSAGVRVNDVDHVVLDGDGTIAVEMEQGGLIVEPLFKSVLSSEVSVTTSDVAIVATEVENGEYRIDDGQWQSSNVFTGLDEQTSHDLDVRIRAYDGLLASDPESLIVTTSTTDEVASQVLSQLRDGVAFKGTYTVARWLDNVFYDETIFDQQVLVSDDQYFLDSCFSDDGTEQHHYDYHRGDDGYAYTATLNRHNEVVSTQTSTAYDDNYYNPFDQIDVDDLVRVDDERFRLDIDSESTLAYHIVNLFSAYSAPLDAMYIYVDETGDVSGVDIYSLHYGTYNGAESAYYERVNLEAVDRGDIEAVQPLTAGFDTTELESTLADLAAHNYTADVTIKDTIRGDEHATYEAFNEGFIITTDDGYEYGYLDTEDGLALFDVNTDSDGNTVLQGRQGYPVEGQEIADLLPDFDISPDLFTKYGSTYTLRDIYSLYDYSYCLAGETIIDDYYIDHIVEGSLKITIADGSATIVYNWYDWYGYNGTITVVYSDLGDTSSSYDLSTYTPFTGVTKWSEFSTSLYDALCSKYGVDVDDVIPFYYDEDNPYSEWYTLVNTIYLPIEFSTSDDMYSFFNAYTAIFEEAGWTVTDNGAQKICQTSGIMIRLAPNTYYYTSLNIMFQ